VLCKPFQHGKAVAAKRNGHDPEEPAMMLQYTLFDPKTGLQFCDELMTPRWAEAQNLELMQHGRAQRWILNEDVPEGASQA
jgi:hypothetical protein